MTTKEEASINLIFLLIISAIFSHSQGLNSFLAAATSTIRVGDELNSTSQLVSNGGNFTLGFFTIPADNYSYLGIWYTNVEQVRKVWVANPNTPIISNSSEVLTVDGTGTLKITRGRSTILNIYDQGRTGNATATLEDSGNFVLKDEAENRTLWQSFDHPTNTLLPGMKLGVKVRTGHNWALTSWLSDDFPASGAFTLSWEPIQDSGQLVIHRRGEHYWTSGVLQNQGFEFMTALNSPATQTHYNLIYISINDENYFTFYAMDAKIPMWFLSPNRQIQDADNSVFLSSSDFCYGYEMDNGCVNSVLPLCRSQRDKFEEKNADFVDNSNTHDDNSSSSHSDCMERCWNDCNCVGFASNSNGTGCIMWTGNEKYVVYERGNSVSKYVLVSENSSKVNVYLDLHF